ncbi:hypothetical protein L6452_05426 [Arctium lappa]|uniref:Uncharacterized protein n=1 Tax=Arctium lappa TaxID=4217 RepID=A0ACB9EGC5_ARCLA|nr:hypothetical protein L6452_05426 [Arctium lappa]
MISYRNLQALKQCTMPSRNLQALKRSQIDIRQRCHPQENLKLEDVCKSIDERERERTMNGERETTKTAEIGGSGDRFCQWFTNDGGGLWFTIDGVGVRFDVVDVPRSGKT